MKIYRLPQLAESSPEGECLLGSVELGTDALYLDYRRVVPRSPEATLAPKDGYELVVYVLKGSVRVKRSKDEFNVSTGEAFRPDGEVTLDNPTGEEAVLIAVGGHARSSSGTSLRNNGSLAKEGPDAAPEPEREAAPVLKSPDTAGIKENDDADFIITTDDPSEDTGIED